MRRSRWRRSPRRPAAGTRSHPVSRQEIRWRSPPHEQNSGLDFLNVSSRRRIDPRTVSRDIIGKQRKNRAGCHRRGTLRVRNGAMISGRYGFGPSGPTNPACRASLLERATADPQHARRTSSTSLGLPTRGVHHFVYRPQTSLPRTSRRPPRQPASAFVCRATKASRGIVYLPVATPRSRNTARSANKARGSAAKPTTPAMEPRANPRKPIEDALRSRRRPVPGRHVALRHGHRQAQCALCPHPTARVRSEAYYQNTAAGR